MLIALEVVQFVDNVRVGGNTLNRVINPSLANKDIEMYACAYGVILKYKAKEHMIPWAKVALATAHDGFSYVEAIEGA